MQNPSISTNEFNTSDIGLAAGLIANGHSLSRLERNSQGKVYFIFTDGISVQSASQRYWANELHVPARALVENLKMLKTRIFA